MIVRSIIFLLYIFFVVGCTVTQSVNKVEYKPLTAEELEGYVSIRNTQKAIEHGFSKVRNYASNYRFLTQVYIDLLMPELKKAKVKLNAFGKKTLSIELYKINIKQNTSAKTSTYHADMNVRLRFFDGRVLEIVSKYNDNGQSKDTNVNIIIHKMIVNAMKLTMKDPVFRTFIKQNK